MTDIICIGEILIDLTQTGFDQAGIPLFAAMPTPAELFDEKGVPSCHEKD